MSTEHQVMNRLIVGMVACVGVGLTVAPAWAGPCSSAIAQLEGAVNRSATRPDIELTLPQTVGAQLGHQPTPESIEQARNVTVRDSGIWEGNTAKQRRQPAAFGRWAPDPTAGHPHGLERALRPAGETPARDEDSVLC